MDKQNSIETIISPDYQSFMICKKFPKSIGIVSSFVKVSNNFESGITVPESRTYRIKKIYEMAPEVCSYNGTENTTELDCISPIHLNTDIFKNVSSDNGILHYDLTFNKAIHEGKEILISEINPRMLLINYSKPKESITKIDIKPFVVEKVKVFTVLLIKGFLIGIANQRKCVLIFTMSNPSRNIVGASIKYDGIDQMIKGLKLMWPIFDIEDKDNIYKIYLKKGIIQNQSKYPKFFRFERFMNDNEVKIKYAGKSIELSE